MKYSPLLAKNGSLQTLKSDNYIFEPKLDGIRAICEYHKNRKPKFYGRYGQILKFDIPLKLRYDSVLDGEIISYNNKGNPDFNLLQQGGTPVYVAFDILEKNKKQLTNLPLLERKKILENIGEDQNNFQTIIHTTNGLELLKIAKKRGIEGVIAKEKNSRYTSGRSGSWLKIKLFKTIDCIVIGYNSGKRKISSLKLGLYDKKENIVQVGNVGSGLTEKMLEKLQERFEDDEEKKPLVCEVKYIEYNKLLRAPVFLRFRDDKRPEDCTMDQLVKA